MVDLQKTSSNLGIDVSDLKMLLTEYFVQADEFLLLLKNASEGNDTITLVTHAHGLKGVSGNMGVESMQQLASDIEASAKIGEFENCIKLINKIEAVLQEEKLALDL
jgi:two-component system sensor histidine kinase/response regulator